MKAAIGHQLRNRRLVCLCLGLGYILYLALVFIQPWTITIPIVIILFIPIAVYEVLLRLGLRLIYGQQYRFALYNYFIINHQIYGNAFRPNTASQTIDFPVFDKFIFKPGSRAAIGLKENKSGRVLFTINSLGFRGQEFSPRKKDGVTRIFCSGGSTTAGNWVNDNETWPAALETELRRQGHLVEVINAGVQGWSSYQELLRFQHEIANYQPDILLLHQGWNEEFAFSSQNLGRWWRPRAIRNMIETRYLYSDRRPLLSSTRSILLLYLTQLIFKDLIFDRNMKFSNPRRWACLKDGRYLKAWFDNLVEFLKLASRRDILLYTIDYPGLCNFDDSDDEKALYIKETRLTPLYADYQRASKKQIQAVLKKAAAIIHCLDVEKDLVHIRGRERLNLFQDEIHMTARGNTWLGQMVAKQLIKDASFQARNQNITPDKRLITAIGSEIGKNYQYIEDFIDSTITQLEQAQHPPHQPELPTDHYTTF